jgi:hypothetical protein
MREMTLEKTVYRLFVDVVRGATFSCMPNREMNRRLPVKVDCSSGIAAVSQQRLEPGQKVKKAGSIWEIMKLCFSESGSNH